MSNQLKYGLDFIRPRPDMPVHGFMADEWFFPLEDLPARAYEFDHDPQRCRVQVYGQPLEEAGMSSAVYAYDIASLIVMARNVAVHPTAQVGLGTVLHSNVSVLEKSRIGEHSEVRNSSTIGPNGNVGDFVLVGIDCSISNTSLQGRMSDSIGGLSLKIYDNTCLVPGDANTQQ